MQGATLASDVWTRTLATVGSANASDPHGTTVANTWDFQKWIPDAVVINLGTNDHLGTNTSVPPSDANGYIHFEGALAKGGDVYMAHNMSFEDAEKWCSGNSSCEGFTGTPSLPAVTARSSSTTSSSGSTIISSTSTSTGAPFQFDRVYFKKSPANINADKNWSTLVQNATYTPKWKAFQVGVSG
jgi:hypothetical protein